VFSHTDQQLTHLSPVHLKQEDRHHENAYKKPSRQTAEKLRPSNPGLDPLGDLIPGGLAKSSKSGV